MKARAIAILALLLIGGSALSQTPADESNQEAQSQCQLSDIDYSVLRSVIDNLTPAHPEEDWAGKEILIRDETQGPREIPPHTEDYWRLTRASKDAPAPAKETFADFLSKSTAKCPITAALGTYKLVSHREIDSLFAKGGGWWDAFYKKYPNAGGIWRLSRPGYNATGDEAVVYVAHGCGGLCGTGHLYLLSKRDGNWKIENRVMLWIS
jgi:hypothetical protein